MILVRDMKENETKIMRMNDTRYATDNTFAL